MATAFCALVKNQCLKKPGLSTPIHNDFALSLGGLIWSKGMRRFSHASRSRALSDIGWIKSKLECIGV